MWNFKLFILVFEIIQIHLNNFLKADYMKNLSNLINVQFEQKNDSVWIGFMLKHPLKLWLGIIFQIISIKFLHIVIKFWNVTSRQKELKWKLLTNAEMILHLISIAIISSWVTSCYFILFSSWNNTCYNAQSLLRIFVPQK